MTGFESIKEGLTALNELSNWIGFGAAIVAALFPVARRAFRFRRLRRAFGAHVKDAHSVFISVPLWNLIEGDRSVPRFERLDPSGQTVSHYGPSEMFAKEDILGAVRLSDFFARFFREPVAITPDAQAVDWENRSAVLIGSHIVNFHSAAVLAAFAAERPQDLGLEFRDLEGDDAIRGRICIHDKRSGRDFICTRESEYAFVLRLPNIFSQRKGGNIFVAAGIRAPGTLAAATYLVRHWEAFARSSGPRTVLLQLQFGQPDTVREVKLPARPPRRSPAAAIGRRGLARV